MCSLLPPNDHRPCNHTLIEYAATVMHVHLVLWLFCCVITPHSKHARTHSQGIGEEKLLCSPDTAHALLPCCGPFAGSEAKAEKHACHSSSQQCATILRALPSQVLSEKQVNRSHLRNHQPGIMSSSLPIKPLALSCNLSSSIPS